MDHCESKSDPGHPTPSTRDYERVAAAIDHIRAQQMAQPTLGELARTMGLSEPHLQRLFSRWAGVSPKRFLQLVTLEAAKRQLATNADVLSASHAAGLSGGGRLYDLFVHLEAVTPGEFKHAGRGLEIAYGFHPSPFGECLLGQTSRGVCYLGFIHAADRDGQLADLRRRWPGSAMAEDANATAVTVSAIFQPHRGGGPPLSLLVRGTNFQVQVWRALLRIPPGQVTHYGAIARWLDRPGASRAVGSAVGANPVAWLIPCHRVLRSDGQLGGYHWGETRKLACLSWEAAAQTR